MTADWERFDTGRYLLNYCSALVPRMLDDAIKTIIVKFPGISREEIVGRVFWSDRYEQFVQHPGWDFEVINNWFTAAKEMIEAERKAYESAKRQR